MVNFEFPEPPKDPSVTVSAIEHDTDYERDFNGIIARIPQDIFTFRSEADAPDDVVSREVSLPFGQTDTVTVVSEHEGSLAIELPSDSSDEPDSALVFEDSELKFRHGDAEIIYEPDAEGVAAGYRVFSVLQADLIAREVER